MTMKTKARFDLPAVIMTRLYLRFEDTKESLKGKELSLSFLFALIIDFCESKKCSANRFVKEKCKSQDLFLVFCNFLLKNFSTFSLDNAIKLLSLLTRLFEAAKFSLTNQGSS